MLEVPGPDGSDRHQRRAALVSRVTENILQRITLGTISLPSMPVAAFDCLELLRHSDFSMQAAARVIEGDPALAARVLAVSNSAAFYVHEKARSVIQATTRLGAGNLRIVLFEAMAIPIYESNDPRIRRACGLIWHHCRAVACCARQIAMKVGADDPSEAYLAGLLHDIGKPIVASLLLKSEHRLAAGKMDLWLEPDTWLEIMQSAHRTAGVALARSWRLPESVIVSVHNPSTYDDASPRTAANCVRLANALAKESGMYVGRMDESHVAGVILAGQAILGLSDDDLPSLRNELYRIGQAPDSNPSR